MLHPPPRLGRAVGIVVDDRTHSYVFHRYFLTCHWEPWETVSPADNGGYPREYIDIRYCVRDVHPLFWAGEAPHVSIEGYDLATGERRSFDGRAVDVVYTPVPPEGDDVDALPGGGR